MHFFLLTRGDPYLPHSTPEVFDIVPNTLSAQPRKNLAEISKMITQITTGEVFGNEAPWMVAVEEYVRAAVKQLSDWFLDVADVVDAETHYHAHEFLDVAVQPKPIYISPNEVYSMHSLLLKNLDALVRPVVLCDDSFLLGLPYPRPFNEMTLLESFFMNWMEYRTSVWMVRLMNCTTREIEQLLWSSLTDSLW